MYLFDLQYIYFVDIGCISFSFDFLISQWGRQEQFCKMSGATFSDICIQPLRKTSAMSERCFKVRKCLFCIVGEKTL